MAASNTWNYAQTIAHDGRDYLGYDVEATDGHIGKVDEATIQTDQSYVIVDTGPWIFGKKRMIPAGVVRRIDDDAKTVYVGMTKEQIKAAPDFELGWDQGIDAGAAIEEYYRPHMWW